MSACECESKASSREQGLTGRQMGKPDAVVGGWFG
jgi:hypothetical protein